MAYNFNPFTGTFDNVGKNASGTYPPPTSSDTEVIFNNAGTLDGSANLTWDDTTGLALGKPLNVNIAGAASTPSVSFLGTWFTGGTSTTTKPKLLIEPSGTTSTAWSTSGTGLGINAASGFTGRLLDAQVNGTSTFFVGATGGVTSASTNNTIISTSTGDSTAKLVVNSNRAASTINGQLIGQWNGNNVARIDFINGADGTNKDDGEIGFYTSNNGSNPVERMRVKQAGVINFASCPTYADDAAAGTGGLAAGDIYKTATGELRIKL